jgi:hypothetical protein
MTTPTLPAALPPARTRRWYSSLWVQVTVGIALAILLGALSPTRAVAMKPLGDGFIRLVTMIITLMIFCTRRGKGAPLFRSRFDAGARGWADRGQRGAPGQRF